MYDELTIERIKTMHPYIREELTKQYLEINRTLPKGVRLRFTHTYRSFEEQDKLFKQRPKVTNAKAGQSYHNYGLAFDIVILLDKDNNGIFESVSWEVDKYWMMVANYFKSKGYKWGGDFKSFKDYPHFEKTFNNTWQELLAKPTFLDNNIQYPCL